MSDAAQPLDETPLSPAAQIVMDQILKLDPADREKLRKRWLYQEAMKEHEEKDIQLRKIEEQQRIRST